MARFLTAILAVLFLIGSAVVWPAPVAADQSDEYLVTHRGGLIKVQPPNVAFGSLEVGLTETTVLPTVVIQRFSVITNAPTELRAGYGATYGWGGLHDRLDLAYGSWFSLRNESQEELNPGLSDKSTVRLDPGRYTLTMAFKLKRASTISYIYVTPHIWEANGAFPRCS